MNTKTKSLFGYIFPALGGLFVTYLYNVVDGIFVGQGIGSAALGAVNIGVPFITFVVAIVGMCVGAAANIFWIGSLSSLCRWGLSVRQSHRDWGRSVRFSFC